MSKENKGVIDKWKKLGIVTWSIIGLILLILGFFFLLFKIKTVLFLFLGIFAIVYILAPVVEYLEKKGISRIFSVVLTYLILLVLISLALTFFIPLIIAQIKSLVDHLPLYFISIQNIIKNYQSQLKTLPLSSPAIDFIENSITQFTDVAIKMASRLPTYTFNVFSVAIYAIIAPLFALVFSFHTLKDLKQIKETFNNLVPANYRNEAKLIIRKIDVILRGFLKGQLLVMLATGTLSWLILLLLGVDYAFALGVAIGVFDIFPYLGPILAGALAVIVALFESPTLALWVAIAMVAVQQIESLFIAPNLMRKQVNLHPLVIVFAMLVGGTLFGIPGVLLAIPVAAVGKGIFYYYFEKYESKDAEL
ncbi:AI-2E family transporter [Candidatus Oleimmundimicrobium sp.]|uniref:AI-2E family transporter n=1 Tax=Candidatus Oleimmundimicrobium sp. TaxID=3060597 RepID=UPI0027256B89|nr:AI-2E family transporter [Candidatus Oleimmundimicrobium sp.]MDO8886740.1 AI-2E family transporter [Candidatus Oleimmundimicrobium sp.]